MAMEKNTARNMHLAEKAWLAIHMLTLYATLVNQSALLAATAMVPNKEAATSLTPANWLQQSKIENFNQFLSLGQIKPASNNAKVRLSEADLVTIALSNSPEIRSAIYQYKQADYQVRSAYGAYYPSLSAFNSSLSGNNSNTTLNYGGPDWGSTKAEKEYKGQIDKANTGTTRFYQGLLGLQISYNLLDMPRDLTISQAIESREYYKKLISYAIKQKLQSVRLAILGIQTADELIKAYKQSAEFAKSAYQQILMSYNKGYSTKIDVDNYYALYNGYQANVATSLSSRQTAVSQLLAQLSWPQTIDIDVDGKMQEPRNWPLTLQQSLTSADRHSEQVQTLIIQSKINYIQAKNEVATYLPVISLNAYGYTNGQAGTIDLGYPAGTINTSISGSISLNLNWTLFDGLSSLNSSKAYKQSALSYQQQSESQKYSIEQSVNSYYALIKANAVAYKLNTNAVKAQEELTSLTLIGYKSGYNTVFDLVNAQQNTVNSLIGQIQSLQNVNSGLIQIQTNTGSFLCNEPAMTHACDLLTALGSNDFSNLNDAKE